MVRVRGKKEGKKAHVPQNKLEAENNAGSQLQQEKLRLVAV